jgi:MYXO-CTERM domain-containing protein
VNLDEVTEDASFLEPLQFEYDSAVFSLPIRLGTINSPGEQDVVMYILTDHADGKVGIANYPQMEIEDECMVDIYGSGGVDTYYADQLAEAWEDEDGAGWIVEYAWSPSSCDPCSSAPPTAAEFGQAGFDGDPWQAYFTRIRMRYTPEAAAQDITLYTSGIIENEQIRFIDHNPLMEDRYPICGLGMVGDPGSCDAGDVGDAGDAGDAVVGFVDWLFESDTDDVAQARRAQGGCSHAAQANRTAGFTLLFGLFAAALRRRQESA